jgi:hypothetical protein
MEARALDVAFAGKVEDHVTFAKFALIGTSGFDF